jgi:hypothetical protein
VIEKPICGAVGAPMVCGRAPHADEFDGSKHIAGNSWEPASPLLANVVPAIVLLGEMAEELRRDPEAADLVERYDQLAKRHL